jgi:hypothetical protein
VFFLLAKITSACYDECSKKRMTNISKAAQRLGRKGGKKTSALDGNIHFSEAGKKGMMKRWGKRSGKAQSAFPPLKVFHKFFTADKGQG